MDAYEREWRRVARSRSTSEIIRWNETEHYYWRRTQEYRQRNAERLRKAELRDKYAYSMTPIENWVGACWVSPSGLKYPVEYSNHYYRADQIVREVLHIMLDEYTSADSYLVNRLGWARIGANGMVTDANWNRLEQLSSEQMAIISEMAVLAASGTAIWCQSGSVEEFLTEIHDSLRFANEQVAMAV